MSRVLLPMGIVGIVGGLLGGCTVVDAPEDFEELVVFAFVNFEERQSFADAAAEGLVPFVEANFKALDVDGGDGYRVSSLTEEDLAAAGIERTLEEAVVGAAGAVRMESSLDDVARAVTYPKLDEIFERTIEFDADSDTDLDCFLAKECELHSQSGNRVNDQPFIGQSSQDFEMAFRWATMEDGRDVLFMRTLIPDETEVSFPGLLIHQNYVLAAFWEEDGKTARVETNWIDAEITGADIPDAFALNSVLGAMEKQAEEIDLWVSGDSQ